MVLIMSLFVILVVYGIYQLAKKNRDNTYTQSVDTDNANQNDEKEEDDGRRVHGHRLMTQEDWRIWYARKEDADEIYDDLICMEKKMLKETTRDPEGLPDQWQMIYRRYRDICLEYGMWNKVLGDCKPFTASQKQLDMEKHLTDRITRAMEEGNRLRSDHQDYMRKKRQLSLKSKELDKILLKNEH